MHRLRTTIKTGILIAALLALALVPAGPVQAQQPSATEDADAPGDVALWVPQVGPAPAPLPGAVTDAALPALDLVAARIFDETPTDITFGLEVLSFAQPPATPLSRVLHYVLCFTSSTTGAPYSLNFQIEYGTPPATDAGTPSLQSVLLRKLDDTCDPWSLASTPTQINMYAMEPSLRLDENRLEVKVPRALFSRLSASDAERPDPAPRAGDTLAGFQGHAWQGVSKAQLWYDATPGDKTFTFTQDAGNEALRISVPDAYPIPFPGRPSLSVPVYGVEIGGLQTVPFTLENDLDVPVTVRIESRILEGEADKWTLTTLPGIDLPAAEDGAPGNETLTLVVRGDLGLQHRDRLRVMLRATSEEHPGELGLAVVDVFALVPPSEQVKTLYFHHTGDTCGGRDYWINTLKADGRRASSPSRCAAPASNRRKACSRPCRAR